MENEELRIKVIQAIKTVYDPEIPVDVYELGLIYDVKVLPLNNIDILMTLTSPSCPSAEELPNQVQTAVSALEEVKAVNVELTFDPPYAPEMMSEAAKLELGFM